MVAQQPHRPDAPAQQAPEHVSAAVIGRNNAVGHQHQSRTYVVSDDPHPHIVLDICPVPTTGELARFVEDWPDLVDFIHVGNALLEEGDPLHAHAGIDVLLGQFANDVEVDLAAHVIDQVLHEHEVPDFYVPGVINGGTAIWTVLGSAVKVDLGTRTCWSRLARGPIVVFAPHALNTRLRKPCNGFPNTRGLVIVFIDGHPQLALVKAKTTIGLGHRQELPGELDGALLEIVSEREVAVHLEEGSVTGGFPDFFDVKRANTFLHTRRPGIGGRHHTGEIRNKGNHACNCEHERRVVAYQSFRRDHGVPAIAEVREPPALDICGFHRFLF